MMEAAEDTVRRTIIGWQLDFADGRLPAVDKILIYSPSAQAIEVFQPLVDWVRTNIDTSFTLTPGQNFICGGDGSESDGIKILGSPIGSDAFCRKMVVTKANKNIAKLQRLKVLAKQDAYILTEYCASAKMDYWGRTVPLYQAEAGLQQFEDSLRGDDGILWWLIDEDQTPRPGRTEVHRLPLYPLHRPWGFRDTKQRRRRRLSPDWWHL
jgi:hypothetical protein